MARISGVDIPKDKRVEVSLTYIYGIGLSTSKRILKETDINPNIRVKDLTEEQVNLIRDFINKNLRVEGDLRRDIVLNIKRLIEIGCYRGIRHRKRLPLRGQRTKTNARTIKGPRIGGYIGYRPQGRANNVLPSEHNIKTLTYYYIHRSNNLSSLIREASLSRR